MPLSEHEQKILDEIERQLYEDDPKLAALVAKAVRSGRDRWKMRLAVVLFIIGGVVMFASFTQSWAIAGAGFLLMVASAGWLAMAVRSSSATPKPGAGDMLERLQRRWRREG